MNAKISIPLVPSTCPDKGDWYMLQQTISFYRYQKRNKNVSRLLHFILNSCNQNLIGLLLSILHTSNKVFLIIISYTIQRRISKQLTALQVLRTHIKLSTLSEFASSTLSAGEEIPSLQRSHR